jgi:multicomponent Na+:H+ antiporter subunit A
MAGLPLSFGYLAKGVVSAAKSETDLVVIISYGLLFVNAVAVAVAAVAAIRVFWGPVNPALEKVREVSWRMLLPPLLIAVIGLEFEFIPTVADPLLIDAARVIAPGSDINQLVADHPTKSFLTATELTLFVGLLLFVFWERLHRMLSGMAHLDRFGPGAQFDHLLNGLSRLAAWHTKALQNGNLASYMRFTLAAIIVICVLTWLSAQPQSAGFDTGLLYADGHTWTLLAAAILVMAGALAAPFLHDRLALLMAIGVVGYGSAVFFLFAGAPDVAFTQLMVETVLVVVAAAVLSQYGTPPHYTEPRLFNAMIAIAAGAGTFLLLIHLFSLPADISLAEWFAEHSLTEAYGRNVVNVVLVDFRAFDTFGEIAVVAFSALAAWPLLRKLQKHRNSS